MEERFTRRMSWFNAPISTYHTENGGKVYATLKPSGTVTVGQLHEAITKSEKLREANLSVLTDERGLRFAKSRALPYFLPYGEFKRRVSTGLEHLSGYFPIDIDGFGRTEEVEEFKKAVWEDRWLGDVRLAFISPSRKGLKLLYDYTGRVDPDSEALVTMIRETQEEVTWYLEDIYPELSAHVDQTGKDLARACFLSFDPNALMRD